MTRKVTMVMGAVVAMGFLTGCGPDTGELTTQMRAVEGVEDVKVEVTRPGAPWNRAGKVVVQVDDGAADYEQLVIQTLVLTAQAFPDESQRILVSFTTDDSLEITRQSTPLPGFEEIVESLPFSEARAISDTGVTANPAKVIAWAEANGVSGE